jgi:hypothetical protein
VRNNVFMFSCFLRWVFDGVLVSPGI